MNAGFPRILILTLTLLAGFALCAVCIMGFSASTDNVLKTQFLLTAARLLTVLFFIVFYYFAMSAGTGLNTVFIPTFLMASVFSECGILEPFSKMVTFIFIPPLWGVTLKLFAIILMGCSLLGFGLYYQNHESAAITRYLFISVAASAALALMLPKTADYGSLMSYTAVHVPVAVLYLVTAVLFTALIITDTPGPHIVRHTAALILSVSYYLNFAFYRWPFYIGTTLLIVANYILFAIVSRSNEIKF